jgi:hypothetical protein
MKQLTLEGFTLRMSGIAKQLMGGQQSCGRTVGRVVAY